MSTTSRSSRLRDEVFRPLVTLAYGSRCCLPARVERNVRFERHDAVEEPLQQTSPDRTQRAADARRRATRISTAPRARRSPTMALL